MKTVRTRIAPSPTGFATVGNLRTALFNYLFAKKHGGEFVLRIEDTDSTRFTEGAEKYIIDSLMWLGIKPDIGIKSDGTAEFRQSEREYRSYAEWLITSGFAYYAFDTSEELESMKKRADINGSKRGYNSISRMNMKNSFTMSDEEVKNRISSGDHYVIRFNMIRNKTITFKDIVKGNVVFDSNTLDDKVLFKSNGMVAYHLANVIDDHLMEITHVIRGDEWVSSTPLHIMLYEAFGWEKPNFCHVPLVLGPDKKKLSKRKMKEYGFTVFPIACSYIDEKGESINVKGFKDEGYDPNTLLNYLALLGWNPGENKEFMTMEEMISLFELEKINNSAAMFDIEKLKHFNAHYLRAKDNIDLFTEHIAPNIPKKSNTYELDTIIKIVELAKERSVFSKDLYPSVSYFFEDIVLSDDVKLKNPIEFRSVMAKFVEFSNNSNWYKEFGVYNYVSPEDIRTKLDEICTELGFKIGKVLPDLRIALTGGVSGPDLPTTMSILGIGKSIDRVLVLNEKYIFQ